MAKKEIVRVELRFEAEVYEGVKKLADAAEISLNQLLQGVARFAVKHGHLGEPTYDPPVVNSEAQPGCLWFGREVPETFEDGSEIFTVGAQVFFTLDFTERHILRDRWKEPVIVIKKVKKGKES